MRAYNSLFFFFSKLKRKLKRNFFGWQKSRQDKRNSTRIAVSSCDTKTHETSANSTRTQRSNRAAHCSASQPSKRSPLSDLLSSCAPRNKTKQSQTAQNATKLFANSKARLDSKLRDSQPKSSRFKATKDATESRAQTNANATTADLNCKRDAKTLLASQTANCCAFRVGLRKVYAESQTSKKANAQRIASKTTHKNNKPNANLRTSKRIAQSVSLLASQSQFVCSAQRNATQTQQPTFSS